MSGKIKVKEVLPRFPPQWPRFDLNQVDVAQSESTQRAKKGPRYIADGKDQRRFPVRIGRAAPFSRLLEVWAPQQEETCEVAAIVFNGASQNACMVDFGCDRGGNGSGVAQPFLHNH